MLLRKEKVNNAHLASDLRSHKGKGSSVTRSENFAYALSKSHADDVVVLKPESSKTCVKIVQRFSNLGFSYH